jgi:hypothetical protein
VFQQGYVAEADIKRAFKKKKKKLKQEKSVPPKLPNTPS